MLPTQIQVIDACRKYKCIDMQVYSYQLVEFIPQGYTLV